MNKENQKVNEAIINGLSLQVWEKPGNRRKPTAGSITNISKLFKTQTLRFALFHKNSCHIRPVSVSLKLSAMVTLPSSVFRSKVSFGDENNATTLDFTLHEHGDYIDIPLVPHYLKDKQKIPVTKLTVSIDQQIVKEWPLTVYNPRYGSRMPRARKLEGLIFHQHNLLWKVDTSPVREIECECLVTAVDDTVPKLEAISTLDLGLDSKFFMDIFDKDVWGLVNPCPCIT